VCVSVCVCVLQCVAVCCGVLQCIAMCDKVGRRGRTMALAPGSVGA